MERQVGAIDGHGRGVVIEEEIEPPSAGQVLVRVGASLISPGTELGGLRKKRENPDPRQAPRPFGYANAGTVEAVGEGVSQHKVGDRVACMGAGYAQHTDLATVPQNLCVPLPASLSFEQGAFAHLAATGLNAVRRAEPQFGENGMVVGLGLLGQLTAQLGQLCGCHMMGVDRLPMRLEMATDAGVEYAVNVVDGDPVAEAQLATEGFGMDFGVIAFGGPATEAFEQIYSSLKETPDGHRMGRIVIVGGAQIDHGFAASLGTVDVLSAARTGPGYHDEEYEHGRDYPRVFVDWSTQRNLRECLRAMVDGRLKVDHLITHRFALDDIGGAVDELVERPETALGVVLNPGT